MKDEHTRLEPTPENPAGAPEPIQQAIRDAFPKDAADILRTLRWHSYESFYSFERWGMFVGVETDGHIHS